MYGVVKKPDVLQYHVGNSIDVEDEFQNVMDIVWSLC